MSDFNTKKTALRAALEGNNPDLVAEIIAWLDGPDATASKPTQPVPLDDDDDIIIHKKPQ